MSILFNPESVQEVLAVFEPQDKLNFLRIYGAACLEAGHPKNHRLAQLVVDMACDKNEVPEVQNLALTIVQKFPLPSAVFDPVCGKVVRLDQAAKEILVPGQKIRGKDIIFINAFEPIDTNGDALGRKLAFFAAPERSSSLFSRDFAEHAIDIARLKNWHGYSGWRKFNPDKVNFSPAKIYEKALFDGYLRGSAIGKWTMPNLELVNGMNADGRVVYPVLNMLELSKNPESPLYGTFKPLFREYASHRVQTYTKGQFGQISVDFPDGEVTLDCRDYPINSACNRPVVALELDQFTL